jgi:hypothetical protein
MLYICFTYNLYVLKITHIYLYVKRIHHFVHFLLFMFQIAFFVQLRGMSSKHVRISSFRVSKVSSPYLAQIVFRSTNQTWNTWFGKLMPIVSTVKLMTSPKTFMKEYRACHTSKKYWPLISWMWRANTGT